MCLLLLLLISWVFPRVFSIEYQYQNTSQIYQLTCLEKYKYVLFQKLMKAVVNHAWNLDCHFRYWKGCWSNVSLGSKKFIIAYWKAWAWKTLKKTKKVLRHIIWKTWCFGQSVKKMSHFGSGQWWKYFPVYCLRNWNPILKSVVQTTLSRETKWSCTTPKKSCIIWRRRLMSFKNTFGKRLCFQRSLDPIFSITFLKN